MPEVRTEYPFQVSYRDDRLPGSLFCLRAETAEELGREYVELLAVLDPILGVPTAEAEVPGPWVAPTEEPTAAAGPAPQANLAPPPVQPVAPTGPACAYEHCGKLMVWRTGVKDGVEWKGWFCPTRNRAHKAVWV